MQAVDEKIANVQHVMRENIQFALQNTDRITNIEAKTELLHNSSSTFREKAVRVKHALCITHWKRTASLIIILIVIGLFAYLLAKQN
jgi:hypothetical protein